GRAEAQRGGDGRGDAGPARRARAGADGAQPRAARRGAHRERPLALGVGQRQGEGPLADDFAPAGDRTALQEARSPPDRAPVEGAEAAGGRQAFAPWRTPPVAVHFGGRSTRRGWRGLDRGGGGAVRGGLADFPARQREGRPRGASREAGDAWPQKGQLDV